MSGAKQLTGFHALWKQAKSSPVYDKAAWQRFERELDSVAKQLINDWAKRTVVNTWKKWHRELVAALGLEIVDRKWTLRAVRNLRADVPFQPPATPNLLKLLREASAEARAARDNHTRLIHLVRAVAPYFTDPASAAHQYRQEIERLERMAGNRSRRIDELENNLRPPSEIIVELVALARELAWTGDDDSFRGEAYHRGHDLRHCQNCGVVEPKNHSATCKIHVVTGRAEDFLAMASNDDSEGACDRAENLRGLLAECLALNPLVSGDMEKVRAWADVVKRMREAAPGGTGE